ncbi:hypothetical protein EPB69_09800 [Geobacillus stearothermophilus]|nr:hypothetical protein EPB69_09800 [Geobacillus stearothermophilus]
MFVNITLMFVSTGKTDDPKDYKSVTGCSALAELLFLFKKNLHKSKNKFRWCLQKWITME